MHAEKSCPSDMKRPVSCSGLVLAAISAFA
jgi:hypothetical protein